MALAGLLLVLAILAIAAASPWITPYNPIAIAVRAKFEPPSLSHWMGTDQLGRDVLSRVIVGARIAAQTAFAAVALAVGIGGGAGPAAGAGPPRLGSGGVPVVVTVRAV